MQKITQENMEKQVVSAFRKCLFKEGDDPSKRVLICPEKTFGFSGDCLQCNMPVDSFPDSSADFLDFTKTQHCLIPTNAECALLYTLKFVHSLGFHSERLKEQREMICDILSNSLDEFKEGYPLGCLMFTKNLKPWTTSYFVCAQLAVLAISLGLMGYYRPKNPLLTKNGLYLITI